MPSGYRPYGQRYGALWLPAVRSEVRCALVTWLVEVGRQLPGDGAGDLRVLGGRDGRLVGSFTLRPGVSRPGRVRDDMNVNLAIVTAWHLVLGTSLLDRQRYIVSLSYDKCTYCKSLFIKASAKCPKCECVKCICLCLRSMEQRTA